MSNVVVVAVDRSSSSLRAVEWAAADAARHHSVLDVVCPLPVRDGGGGPLSEDHRGFRRSEGHAILTAARQVVEVATRGAELEIRTEITAEPAVEAMAARSANARLVVVGSRGRGPFGGDPADSAGASLVRIAHCPVVVVHRTACDDPVSLARPVVVGIDGTRNSLPAIEIAFDQAARRGVGLLAVHAWRDNEILGPPAAGWAAVQAPHEAVLAESLAGWSERYPQVRVDRSVAYGPATRVLLEASEKAQLFVIGSHGRGGFAGMTLGSISTALAHWVECPIIVARSR